MTEPEEVQPISVALMTGVRWSTLASGAQRSAIRSQDRSGGASNPHASLISIAKGYLTGRYSKVTALKAARRVGDTSKRKYVRDCLKNLIRAYPYIAGSPRPMPPPTRRKGPKGLVELKVVAHVFIQGETDRYIGFWANQEPALTAESARLFAQMMRESVATDENKACYFEIVDLRRGRRFAYDVNDLDEDPADLQSFFRHIEDVIEQVRH